MFTIQQLTAADAGAYQTLRLYALQESPTAFGSSYDEEANHPLDEVIERLMDPLNHVFGFYLAEGRLGGIVTLRRDGHLKSAHKAYVFAMYVLPELRNQGAGKLLMQQVIGKAEELHLKQLNLAVVAANMSAVHLYKSLGFQHFGLERDAFKVNGKYYDVAFMSLELGSAVDD